MKKIEDKQLKEAEAIRKADAEAKAAQAKELSDKTIAIQLKKQAEAEKAAHLATKAKLEEA